MSGGCLASQVLEEIIERNITRTQPIVMLRHPTLLKKMIMWRMCWSSFCLRLLLMAIAHVLQATAARQRRRGCGRHLIADVFSCKVNVLIVIIIVIRINQKLRCAIDRVRVRVCTCFGAAAWFARMRLFCRSSLLDTRFATKWSGSLPAKERCISGDGRCRNIRNKTGAYSRRLLLLRRLTYWMRSRCHHW